MEHKKVTCDCCDKDLTTTTNCEGWLIEVTSERIPSLEGVVTLAHVEPPLGRSFHFCSATCLKKWSAYNL